MPKKYNEKYTRELLTEAVANSISIADVLRYLQIPFSGGTHAHISRRSISLASTLRTSSG
jgi:hypothetical protein